MADFARFVLCFSLLGGLSGCITQSNAAKFLIPDARSPPHIWNNESYTALAERLNKQEYVLAANGLLDCSDALQDGRPSNRPCKPVQQLKDTGFTHRQAVDAYLEGRIQQIDKLCDAYLHTLAEMGDTSRWTRTQFNAVADVGSMILGLAETPAQQLAYLAAGKSLYNQSADNLESYLLLTPSADKIERLVYSAQSDHRGLLAVVRQSDDRAFWATTSRWIQDYAAFCTPRGIRGLLNVAIEKQTPAPASFGAGEAAAALGFGMEASLRAFASEMSEKTDSWPSLSDPTVLGSLAWKLDAQTSLTNVQKEFVNYQLGSTLSGFTDTLLTKDHEKKVNELRSKIASQRGRYGELIRLAQAAQASQSADNRAEAAEAELKKKQGDINQLQDEINRKNESIAELKNEINELRARLPQVESAQPPVTPNIP